MQSRRTSPCLLADTFCKPNNFSCHFTFCTGFLFRKVEVWGLFKLVFIVLVLCDLCEVVSLLCIAGLQQRQAAAAAAAAAAEAAAATSSVPVPASNINHLLAFTHHLHHAASPCRRFRALAHVGANLHSFPCIRLEPAIAPSHTVDDK